MKKSSLKIAAIVISALIAALLLWIAVGVIITFGAEKNGMGIIGGAGMPSFLFVLSIFRVEWKVISVLAIFLVYVLIGLRGEKKADGLR